MLVHEGVTFEPVWNGALMSLVAGVSTGKGGLPVLFLKEISHRTLDTMLGFATGVTLAATAFSLLIPAIELGGVSVTTAAFLGRNTCRQVSKCVWQHSARVPPAWTGSQFFRILEIRFAHRGRSPSPRGPATLAVPTKVLAIMDQ